MNCKKKTIQYYIEIFFFPFLTGKKRTIELNSDDDFLAPQTPKSSKKPKTVNMDEMYKSFDEKLMNMGVTKEMLKDPM